MDITATSETLRGIGLRRLQTAPRADGGFSLAALSGPPYHTRFKRFKAFAIRPGNNRQDYG
jgi:hypothetical protein